MPFAVSMADCIPDPYSFIWACMASAWVRAKDRLDLHHLLHILGPHQPLGIIQRGAEVLFRSGQGLLGHVLGAGLNLVAGLLHALAGAPSGLQEALQGLAGLSDARSAIVRISSGTWKFIRPVPCVPPAMV